MRTVDVIPLLRFPWNAPSAFTYQVPDGDPVPPIGSWVRVPFRGKTRSAVVTHEGTSGFISKKLLYIQKLEDALPLSPRYLEFINTVARATLNHPARFLSYVKIKYNDSNDVSAPRIPIRNKTHEELLWWGDETLRHAALLARAQKFKSFSHLILSPTIEDARVLHEELHAQGIDTVLFRTNLPAARLKSIATDLLCGAPITIIGTRAALFLPFTDLAAITVDSEEHWAYNQAAPPPRYHGVPFASLLGRLHHADMLFISSSPRIESFLELPAPPPDATLSTPFDIIDKTSFNFFQEPIAPQLIERMQAAIHNGERVLVIAPETGFAHYLICRDCRYLFRCPDCHLVLSSESAVSKELTCNRCSYRELIPPLCPSCHSVRLTQNGFGAVRLMHHLRDQNIDTAHVHAHATDAPCVIVKFQETIPHALSFQLLIVADADPLFSRTGYATTVHALQELIRLRLTARSHNAHFVIQTSTPEHPIFFALSGNARTLYDEEIRLRKAHRYPPFATVIRVTLPASTPRDKASAERAFAQLNQQLTAINGELISSPAAYRRRKRIVAFTIRTAPLDPASAAWTALTDLLKKSLPASAIIEVNPDSI